MRTNKSVNKGFTLIELVVVVAIIGIIATIAWSYFNQESIRNRRSEAVSVVSKIANELVEYKADKKTYVGYTISLGISNNLRWYTAAVSNLGINTYTVTLTPIAGGAQADDADCTTLTINEAGLKGYTGSAPSAQRCWSTAN